MIVLIILFVIFVCICTYLEIRNFRVLLFRRGLLNMCEIYEKRRIYNKEEYNCPFEWFFNKYTYENMLFNIKPLKLKYWYNDCELTEILR